MAFLGVWKISEMKIDEAHIIEGVISHLLVSGISFSVRLMVAL